MSLIHKNYCLGFAFNADCTSVLLIKKERPAWQRGFLNGIGGKVEPNETPIQAMQREFGEEAGIDLTVNDWIHFCTITGSAATGDPKVEDTWEMFCFCVKTDDIYGYKNGTDEEINFKTAIVWNDGCLHNVNWLLAMARARLLNASAVDLQKVVYRVEEKVAR